ncbi:hypothetical protein H310_14649 [Aphanomyces invadans]|uniref:Terpene cyclase/mutase family member n=1 Tax=Aphanomyces invadans TaxID=157072 RepID=A0A024T9D3_9STRA|nr:hypothetical protein H310_14649 [Aphanomyces invadans]ETV90614.1 hypothetical protein H310_14649 [Aphanomyces invadans]|eukprot:XP_008880767.1 hypothetical protein H310_14649 [Aphanomyces invadans]
MSEEVLLFLAPAIKYILELLFDPLVFSVIAVSLFLYKLLPTTDPVLPLSQMKKANFQARSHVFSTDLKLVVGSKTGPDGKTPVSGNVAGRQVWRPKGDVVELPAFSASENPNAGDKLLRKLLVEGKKIPSGGNGGNIDKALRQAVDYYKLLQSEDGSWHGDYGGPMFLLPGLVITSYITGHDLGKSVRDGMIVYLRNHQQYDGGWGIHIEEGSTMFGTVLNYVALRLLGAAADDEACLEARTFIKHHGGATLVPSWGKFWLAVLNVYDWRGVDALPPEMWLLPRWLPFHPGRTWVHCRMVYLPMSYLYGIRFQAKETPLIQAIRDEIYTTPYQSVSWRNARGAYSKMDEYHTPSPIIRTLNYLLSWYELLPTVTSLRKHGLEYTLAFVRADDEESNYCNIGPVNKMINMLVQWVVDPDSDEFKRHAQRVEDYIWVAEDGVKMQGYVGSQTWDSSFAVQAFVDAGVAADPAFQTTFKLAYRFLTEAQNVHDPKDAATWWRRVQKGGWGFGIASNGYPVSDCTAEAVKALLLMEERANLPAFPDDRLRDAVDFILALQNSDGGFPPYERSRGFDWYEHLNPAVVFGAIMHDYSYVECSSSSLSALQAFHARHPTYRPEAIKRATTKADTFIRSLQYQDGSFFGKWGVCYTYGTMFAIKGMRAAGASDKDEDVQDAVSFLVNKQRNDGGWSESFFACSTRRYLETPSSLVVNTAWALIGIMKGIEGGDPQMHVKEWDAVKKGIEFLVAKQLPSGDWAQERISGVFNRTCGITYANYRNIFPIWAIGLYQKLQRTK